MSVGDEAAGAAIQIMDQRSRTIDQISELIARILENMTRRSVITKEDNRGVKNLMRHLENGRRVDITPVFKEDGKMLDDILRSMKIPFVMGMDHEKDKMLLMTRDQDREALKDVLCRYAIRKGMETQEVAIENLLSSFNGKEIRIQKGLDIAEVELFKEKARQYDCIFSVIRSKEKDGTYDLVYPRDKGKNCEDVLKDISYDFTGDEGRKYKALIQDNIRKRQEFIEGLRPNEGEILYICSKEEPCRFISVTKDVCALHNLQVMGDSHTKDSESRLYDACQVISNTFSRENLQNLLDKMTEPVVISPREFGIVKSISISGRASFVQGEEFRGKYQKLCEVVKNSTVMYPERILESDSLESEKALCYENLTGTQLDDIQEKLSGTGCERYLVTGNDDNGISVAFPEIRSEKMKPVIEGVLYGNAEGVEFIQKKLLHEGRGILDIHKSGDIVIDVSVPGVALFFEENRMNIVQRQDRGEEDQNCIDGEGHDNENTVLMSIERADPEYDHKVMKLIGLMDNPVVIQKNEYQQKSKKDLARIIRVRTPSEHKSKAETEYVEYLRNQRQSVYDQLHARTDDQRDIDNLSERQKEALRKYFSRQYEDMYLSGSDFSGTAVCDRMSPLTDRGDVLSAVYGQEHTSVH